MTSAVANFVWARNGCQKDGGDLASVYDDAKNDFLPTRESYMDEQRRKELSVFPSKTKFWLGLQYNETSDAWEWVDRVRECLGRIVYRHFRARVRLSSNFLGQKISLYQGRLKRTHQ